MSSTITDTLGHELAIGDNVHFEVNEPANGATMRGLGNIKTIDASIQSVLIEIMVEGRPTQYLPCDLSNTKLTKRG